MTENKELHREGITGDALTAWDIDNFEQEGCKRLNLKPNNGKPLFGGFERFLHPLKLLHYLQNQFVPEFL